MARKRKASDDLPSPSDNSNDPVPKKPKVDWSAIDDFQGFTVTAANAKAQKKLRNAAANKHKAPTKGKPPKYPGQDAPLDANVVQSNPFPQTELSQVHVKISPTLHWESTSRYRKFTINSEEFQVGQIVFVKNSEESSDKNPPNAVQGWLAKILEIRAGDSSHVFLRVFWVYRPEDLPGGRKPHHASNEVIVSNHMDVIEAVTVQSLADTVYWNDDPDTLPLPADQLFFRQSYDITKRLNPFSALKKYCIDNKPINPDELLVQCSHCSEWLHAHCLEQEATRKVSEAHQPTSPPLKKNNKHPKANVNNSNTPLRFSAKISASDTGKVRLTITDNRASEDQTQEWDVDISCLMCAKVIERADGSLSPTDPNSLSDDVAEENENENVTVTINIKDAPPNDDSPNDDSPNNALPDDAAAAVSKPEPAPEDPAGTNAPRQRGRPPGSTKKKKHASASLAEESPIPHVEHSSTSNTSDEEDVAPPTVTTPTNTTQTSPTTNALTSTTATTTTTTTTTTVSSVSYSTKVTTSPQPAPVHDSLMHSGVLSIEQLLWTE